MKKIIVSVMLLTVAAQAFPEQINQSNGIIVESLVSGLAAEKSGIMPDDILLSWERLPSLPANPEGDKGLLSSPFDLSDTETEESSRGQVTVKVNRSGEILNLDIQPGEWGINAKPLMDKESEIIYEKGRAFEMSKDYDSAFSEWNSLVKEENTSDAMDIWLLSKMAKSISRKRNWEKAISACDWALVISEKLKNPVLLRHSLKLKAMVCDAKNDYDSSIECFMKILELKASPLIEADCLNGIACAYCSLGKYDKAIEFHGKALKIKDKEAPESLFVAATLNNLGLTFHLKGELETAGGYYFRSLAIKEKIIPESQDTAFTLNNLGVLEFRRGNLEIAGKYLKRVLSIREKSDPGSLMLAASYNNMGMICHETGELKRAEEYYRKSLGIKETIAPESIDTAVTLNNLGLISYYRGDIESSESALKKALQIYEKISYSGAEKIWPLNNLALVNYVRQDFDTAEKYYEMALELQNNIAPDSLDSAIILHNLGLLAMENNEFDKAESYLGKALEIKHGKNPGSLDEAKTLSSLGTLAEEAGDLEKAEMFYSNALGIASASAPHGKLRGVYLFNLGSLSIKKGDNVRAKELLNNADGIFMNTAPGSWYEAMVLHQLGSIAKEEKDYQTALQYFTKSVETLEIQKGKLGGGNEAEEKFAARYSSFYRDLIELQVEMKMEKNAFLTLEKFKARTLLNMIAEKDIVFSNELSEDILSERNRTNREYEAVLAEIEENENNDAENVADLNARLKYIRKAQNDLKEKIKEISPRFASLQYPEPLDFNAVIKFLNKNACLVSYCVCEGKTIIFCIYRGRLNVFQVNIKQEDLLNKVAVFRQLITDPATDIKLLRKQSEELFRILLHPVEKFMRSSDEIIICADFPLHYISFGALASGKGRFLADYLPVSTVISATLLNELTGTQYNDHLEYNVVAAFGDPVYVKPGTGGEPEESVYRGRKILPLPYTRKEVSTISGIFSEKAMCFYGEEASEENAKEMIRDTSLIHFACHGFLDEKTPLDSALILSLPIQEKKENGLLQAWEIFEQVRINADLVTLSACETGLGKEMGGEGMIGLTRAFQYAGAKAVMSSLWSVSDESTADLMSSFYKHLKSGKSKAEALRMAQSEMMRSKKYAHPFYWAGFVLNGCSR